MLNVVDALGSESPLNCFVVFVYSASGDAPIDKFDSIDAMLRWGADAPSARMTKLVRLHMLWNGAFKMGYEQIRNGNVQYDGKLLIITTLSVDAMLRAYDEVLMHR